MPAERPPQDEAESENKSVVRISPTRRNHLQRCFELGRRGVEVQEYEIAAKMFSECLLGDPGNLLYGQNFLALLRRKFASPERLGKLARLKSMGRKSALRKSRAKRDWAAAAERAIGLLQVNPWDTAGLTALAEVCEAYKSDGAQLFYLKSALDTNPQDSELNGRMGRALANMGQFDESLVHWRRVEQACPEDKEARKNIERLSAGKPQTEEPLEAELAKNPLDVQLMIRLADRYLLVGQADRAETLLARALAISGGGNLAVCERLETCRIEQARRQVEIAQQRADQQGTEEAEQLLQQIQNDANRTELEIYAARNTREPGNSTWKHELGLRLKRAGRFAEAIDAFQQTDPQATILVELGECHQHLCQYDLAMEKYEQAVEANQAGSTDGGHASVQKLSLYRAGVLAMGLEMWEKAEKHLSELGQLDLSYKDVGERLDKLPKIHHKG